MKCPIDESPLSVSSRDGVEIDFCPQCRGVWLDRGELDKIIDRAATTLSTAPTTRGYEPVRDEPRFDDDRRRYEDRGRDDDRTRGRPRKRRSFLDDLFDFD